jgi:hypothetical protein
MTAYVVCNETHGSAPKRCKFKFEFLKSTGDQRHRSTAFWC